MPASFKSNPFPTLNAGDYLGTWPGQQGNPVGFFAAPGYVGDSLGSGLTAWPGGGFTSNTNYSFFDFDGGNGAAANVTANGAFGGALVNSVTFIGCRFQSNDCFNDIAVCVTGGQAAFSTNVKFSYCTFGPRVANISPNITWPSAGAGAGLIYSDAGARAYTTPCDAAHGGNFSNQFSLGYFGLGMVADHCDFWGFGNAIMNFAGGETLTDCWAHYCAQGTDIPGSPSNPQSTNFHTSAAGYFNGAAGVTGVTIRHCTLAILGNTNVIAFQGATSPYSFITVVNNYIVGSGISIDMCHGTGGVFVTGSNHLLFTDNFIGTELPFVFGSVFGDETVAFSVGSNPTNLWRRNTVKGGFAGASTVFTQGFFLYPDGSTAATDYSG
jgi:hypothetical protein